MAAGGAEIGIAQFGACYDLQLDHFGKRLALACADGMVRILSSENGTLQSELRGHRGPVLTLCWADPRLGSMLVSGAEDNSAMVWREQQPGQWQIVHTQQARGVVNSVAFAPFEYGLLLALASGDGEVTVVGNKKVQASAVLPAGESWPSKSFAAHDGGVLSLSWGPSTSPVALASGPAASAAKVAPKRLVTGGADRMVRIWRHENDMDMWSQVKQLDQVHGACVQSVAWRPNLGVPCSLIASCAEDGTVVIWVQDMEGQQWYARHQWRVDAEARRLTWSKAGTVLSVSAGERKALLYREGLDGLWEPLTTLDGEGDVGCESLTNGS